jgi:hypothetical protein
LKSKLEELGDTVVISAEAERKIKACEKYWGNYLAELGALSSRLAEEGEQERRRGPDSRLSHRMTI